MTDKQRAALKELIAEHTRKTTVSKEVARRSLIDEGIHTEDGELAPEYGGSVRHTDDQRTIYFG
ncbi:hypothetical protein [Agrobacterium larrymoorei]|uniref:Uncharacterized protein n=1 Tax=Agrobacterium larrymoorei TaxID=160699 RepID=A0AAF0H7Z3_9HYPH|nr:hypothetical protein [Agrobacterium larrymoorei]WHA40582.1 hypothetical protein CFBP5477_012230 [Agrobacterium larrymoorei]